MRSLLTTSLSLSALALALAGCVPPRPQATPPAVTTEVGTTAGTEAAPDTRKLVAEAQAILDGDFGTPNPERAAALLTEAVEHYSTSALIPLGNLYRTGRGVPVDAAKAKELFERAITAGEFRNGHYALGTLYTAGTLRNPALALSHFQRAASVGSGPALIAMGNMYRTGDGVPANLEQARLLYQEAIRGGATAGGAFGLGLLYRDLQPPDPERAIAYFEQAAAAGRGSALTALGDMFRDGKGVVADPARAAEYYQRAIDAGEVGPAAFALANLYRAPTVGNPAGAVAYLEQSAAAGRAASYTTLANMYRAGEGVPVDLLKARRYYEQAIAAGDVKGGAYGLGVLARQAPTPDLFGATRYFQDAAAAGSGPANVALAEIARQARDDPAQRAAMITYYKQAATQTSVESVARSVLRARGPALIATIEGLLQSAGYDPGGLDGRGGPQFESALLSFCAAQAVAGCSADAFPEALVIKLLQAPGV